MHIEEGRESTPASKGHTACSAVRYSHWHKSIEPTPILYTDTHIYIFMYTHTHTDFLLELTVVEYKQASMKHM